MAGHDSPGSKTLRMSAETFRGRQLAGERTIVLDVRSPKDWDASDRQIPGAVRAYPEPRIDPQWPRDCLILAY